MNYLRLFRLTLAELFVLVTFFALGCVALLSATDRTAWIVGGCFWLAILVAMAVAATPGAARRPFCLGFLGAALLHLGLMQYTSRYGQSNYDLDMPTFYLVEVMWHALPADRWPQPPPQPLRIRVRPGGPFPAAAALPPGTLTREAAHANFQGIATQLFSIFYGMLTGFLAQGMARVQRSEIRDQQRPLTSDL